MRSEEKREYDQRRYTLCWQKHRWYQRMKRFGVSRKQFERMMENQGGKCAICRRAIDNSCNIDHDHSTKEVRGLLCRSCNLGIGFLAESPDILRRVINYLIKEIHR